MPRSGKITKRDPPVDPIYRSKSVGRFVNFLMKHGKKDLTKKIAYGALSELSQDRREAAKLFDEIIRRVMPDQEVRPRRVGGATYQVPMPVRFERGQALAFRWLIGAASAKKGKPMVEKLGEELKLALKGEGDALKKREQVHKMAEANKAFAHFRIA